MERERIRGENEWAELFTPAPSVQMVQVPLAQLVPWEQADGSPHFKSVIGAHHNFKPLPGLFGKFIRSN